MYLVRAARQPGARTIATPLELNAELATVLSQLNGGLDLENVQDGTIGPAQIRDGGQFHQHATQQYDNTEVTTLRLTPSFGRLYPWPTSTGAVWREQYSIPEEAMVRVTLSATVAVVGTSQFFAALFVNGELVARTDAVYGNNGDLVFPVELDGVAAAPAGEVLIEPIWGFARNVATTTTQSEVDIEFTDRALLLDWMYR